MAGGGKKGAPRQRERGKSKPLSAKNIFAKSCTRFELQDKRRLELSIAESVENVKHSLRASISQERRQSSRNRARKAGANASGEGAFFSFPPFLADDIQCWPPWAVDGAFIRFIVIPRFEVKREPPKRTYRRDAHTGLGRRIRSCTIAHRSLAT